MLVPGKSSLVPSLKFFEFSEYRRSEHENLFRLEYFFHSSVLVGGVSFLWLAETYSRRDLYQAEGLLDPALNLVGVDVHDSIEEKMR